MIQSRGPVPSPEGDLLASLDWLVDGAAGPQQDRLVPHRSIKKLLRASMCWLQSQAVGRTTLLYMLGLLALAAIVAWLFWQGADAPQQPAAKRAAPPRIESPFAPGTMRDLSREEAIAWNTAAGDAPTRAAASFVLESPLPTDYQRSVECLAQAIHYEAATEGIDGGRAVAQVVLNRVRHPAYPDTVCGVVYEGAKRTTGCQFTFACDGSLARTPAAPAWRRARAIAISALAGNVYEPVGWSTHYHANYVVPYWAASLQKTASVGAHIFYRWTGNWGEAGAFSRRYAGNEPLAALLLGTEPGATEVDEAKIAAASEAERALTDARPVLIAPTQGALGPGVAAPVAREVALGDRQILLPPSSTRPAPENMSDALER